MKCWKKNKVNIPVDECKLWRNDLMDLDFSLLWIVGWVGYCGSEFPHESDTTWKIVVTSQFVDSKIYFVAIVKLHIGSKCNMVLKVNSLGVWG